MLIKCTYLLLFHRMVIELSNKLRKDQQEQWGSSQPGLSTVIQKPSFVWVVRDFQLELVDEAGNEITPSDYLEVTGSSSRQLCECEFPSPSLSLSLSVRMRM